MSIAFSVAFEVGAATLPNADIGDTMSIQFHDGDASSQVFALISAAGYKMIRKGVYWSDVESKKGVYDFSYPDSIVNASLASGQRVLITLYSNNSLYETVGSNDAIVTDAGRAGFAAFAAAAATHYMGKNVYFEIWNEPNLGQFWRAPSNTAGIAAEYTALVKAAVPAMHAADPNAYVTAGSIAALWSESFAWFDACIQNGILASGINAVSVHPYGFDYPELEAAGYATIRSKVDAAGYPNVRIVASEIGYEPGDVVAGQAVSTANAPIAQGWALVRQQLVDLANNIGFSNWYELRDDNDFGILTTNLTPVPMYNYAKVLTQQLGGYRFVQRLSTSSSKDYVYLMQNASGQKKLAAWTTGSPAVVHSISIPVSVSASSLNTVAVDGTLGSLAVSGSAVSVSLSGGPVYIDLGSSASSTPPVTTPPPVVTPPVASNVAPLGSVQVSSGTGAAALNDGKTSGAVWTSNRQNPQSITISLPKAYSISEVDYFQAVQRTSSYQVLIWTGTVWQSVASVNGNTSLNLKATFAPVTGTRVRLLITLGAGRQQGYELQVMGAPP